MTDPQPASTTPDQPLPDAENTKSLDVANQQTEVPQAETTAEKSDDLPEWEPLSPEIVEDEAIRGDFMLRWAVILLALLLGCRHIAETQTLVHIRAGQYMASHGFLPPRTDVFSFTAGDRPWVNLSWLFDLLLAGLHGIGGPAVLSGAVAVGSACLVYWLVNVSRRNVPTWWHAVCAGLVLLALQGDFVPLPRLITFLGVAWFVRELVKWSESRRPRALWCLVGSLAVWANLDPRAYVGWLLLVGFGTGQVLASRFGRESELPFADKQSLFKAMGGGLVALLINPFGWQALLSPFIRFGTELPWMRSNAARITDLGVSPWQSLFDVSFWKAPSTALIALAVLVLTAIVTTIMNRRRVDLGLLIATALVTVVGLMSWEDFGPALVAMSVLAALNGQDWYRANCRTEYSIATWEVLYSRVGRAITVIAFGCLAYSAISGRLMGRDGTRVGFGWTPQLAANISGTASELQKYSNAKFFQFRMDQGDLAIWSGHPVFFDRRVRLYARGGENILAAHDVARSSLRQLNDGRKTLGQAVETLSTVDADARVKEGREVFDRFGVTHLAARLWGSIPGYGAFLDAARAKDWQLEALGATTAIFGRRAKEQGGSVGVDFSAQAFRDCKPTIANTARMMWPQAQTGYQRFLSLKGTPVSNAAQRARHYIELLQANQEGRVTMGPLQAIAMCVLAIRDSQAALFEDNSNVSAYVRLADAYSVLGMIEGQISAASGYPAASQQRLFQSISAMHQALILDPENISLRMVLLQKYLGLNRVDSVDAEIKKIMKLYREKPLLTEEDLKSLQRIRELSSQLGPTIERVEEALANGQKNNADTMTLAGFAQQQGFHQKALELLEADKLKLSGNMAAQLQMAMLLSECGRLEEANSMFETFDEVGGGAEPMFGSWQGQAAFVSMARGDYDRAVAWTRKQRKTLQKSSFEAMLGTAPIRSFDAPLVATKASWPIPHVAASEQVLFNVADQIAMLSWTKAIAHLEAGDCAAATQELQDLVKHHPRVSFSAIGSVYLQLLTGQPTSLVVPGESVPVLFEDGTGDQEPITAEAK